MEILTTTICFMYVYWKQNHYIRYKNLLVWDFILIFMTVTSDPDGILLAGQVGLITEVTDLLIRAPGRHLGGRGGYTFCEREL